MEIFTQGPEKQKAPLLLFLHGAATDKGIANISAEWFEHWVNKGYAVAAISMPGYGQTTGNKDFCGPLTIQSLHFAIDSIQKELGVLNFGIIGFGQGSIAGLLLAAQRGDVRCLLSANGGYDLLSHLQPGDRLTQTLLAKNYAITIDEEAFKKRSPLEYVHAIETSIFVLHRDGNPVIPVDEAVRFAEAMRHAGKECCLSILPKHPGVDEQKISYEEILDEAEDWIDAQML